MTEELFKEREKVIQKRLKSISNRKYKIIWAIFVTLFYPFVVPCIRFRRMEGTFGETLGYWNTVMLFLITTVFIMSIGLYQFIDKIKKDKFDAEADLRRLKKGVHRG